MQELEGRVAVITGAASGIGLATAHRLATEGMHVVLADIEDGPLAEAETAVAAHGRRVLAVRTDFSSEAAVNALADAAFAAEVGRRPGGGSRRRAVRLGRCQESKAMQCTSPARYAPLHRRLPVGHAMQTNNLKYLVEDSSNILTSSGRGGRPVAGTHHRTDGRSDR